MPEICNDNYYITSVNIVKDNKTIYLNVTQVEKNTKHERQIITGFRNPEEAKDVRIHLYFFNGLTISLRKGMFNMQGKTT